MSSNYDDALHGGSDEDWVRRPYLERLEAWKGVRRLLNGAIGVAPSALKPPGYPWGDGAARVIVQLRDVLREVDTCIRVTEVNCRLAGELPLLKCEWREDCKVNGWTEEELGDQTCDEECPRCDLLREAAGVYNINVKALALAREAFPEINDDEGRVREALVQRLLVLGNGAIEVNTDDN